MFPVAVTFLILVRRHYDKLRTSGFADHVLLLVMAMHTHRGQYKGAKSVITIADTGNTCATFSQCVIVTTHECRMSHLRSWVAERRRQCASKV